MKPFKYFLDQVGYDGDAKAPDPIYVYFAYKEGAARQYWSFEDAQRWSKNTERVQTNKAEVELFWKERQAKEVEAFALWKDELRGCYAHLTPEVFEICYDEAYERGHAYGHDEVGACMVGVVEFAERLLEVK